MPTTCSDLWKHSKWSNTVIFEFSITAQPNMRCCATGPRAPRKTCDLHTTLFVCGPVPHFILLSASLSFLFSFLFFFFFHCCTALPFLFPLSLRTFRTFLAWEQGKDQRSVDQHRLCWEEPWGTLVREAGLSGWEEKPLKEPHLEVKMSWKHSSGVTWSPEQPER